MSNITLKFRNLEIEDGRQDDVEFCMPGDDGHYSYSYLSRKEAQQLRDWLSEYPKVADSHAYQINSYEGTDCGICDLPEEYHNARQPDETG